MLVLNFQPSTAWLLPSGDDTQSSLNRCSGFRHRHTHATLATTEAALATINEIDYLKRLSTSQIRSHVLNAMQGHGIHMPVKQLAYLYRGLSIHPVFRMVRIEPRHFIKVIQHPF